jgi:hypothetical protein
VGDRPSGDESMRRLLVEVLQDCSGATEAEILSAENFYDEGILTSLSLAYVVTKLQGILGLELMHDLRVPDWKNVDSIAGLLSRKEDGS